MVIVPGLNDGDVLEESLSDLWNMGDAVLTDRARARSGLTRFSHLYTGETMNPAYAARILSTAEKWGERGRNERGFTWVSGSDELSPARRPRTSRRLRSTGDYPQIENGVGAGVTALRERVADGLSRLPRLDGKHIGVVTGALMMPLMPPLLEPAQWTRPARDSDLMHAENSLFGPTTTTAGLLDWCRYAARTGRSHCDSGHGFDTRRNDQRKRTLSGR